MAFDYEAPQKFVIGTIIYGGNAAFVRQEIEVKEVLGKYESVSVKRYKRDVFGNKYDLKT